MGSPSLKSTELITGMSLDLDEFLSRWEALPDLKNAELIDGIVHIPGPVWVKDGSRKNFLNFWLGEYTAFTPGCDAASRVTCVMLGQSPQPDVLLRLNEDLGGKSFVTDKYLEGALELVAELCATSTEVDFGPKLELYQQAGVQEYITFETLPQRIVWRVLVDGRYQEIQPDEKGILRSECFPGLWLNTEAFWAGDGGRLRETINAGLESTAHREFVELLKQPSK